jgi:hypothetical protein
MSSYCEDPRHPAPDDASAGRPTQAEIDAALAGVVKRGGIDDIQAALDVYHREKSANDALAAPAEAMRERAATVLDEYAKNAATLAETKPEDGFDDRREEFQGTASILRAIAAQIRRLPLPARDDAVEEARNAVVAAARAQREAAVAAFHARGAERNHLEAVWDGATNVTQDAVARLLAAERDAALRREKGGDK